MCFYTCSISPRFKILSLLVNIRHVTMISKFCSALLLPSLDLGHIDYDDDDGDDYHDDEDEDGDDDTTCYSS
jgi:hypothetical protein